MGAYIQTTDMNTSRDRRTPPARRWPTDASLLLLIAFQYYRIVKNFSLAHTIRGDTAFHVSPAARHAAVALPSNRILTPFRLTAASLSTGNTDMT